ncbi:MAG: VWA domain-containing protein [Chitinophagaceae bacterium]|nr:VWA domain-containing protein [Oligoflexus sp.]
MTQVFGHRPNCIFALFLCTVAMVSCKTSSYRWVEDAKKPDLVSTKGNIAASIQAPEVIPAGSPESVIAIQEMHESFRQSDTPAAVDILVVIDNSSSMEQEQANLSTKLSDLLTEIKDSDWQIGVITSTVQRDGGRDKCVLTVIKPTDANYQSKFMAAVTPGTFGSNTEEGIRQAVNGLRCPDQPWVREHSSVAVLIVSDEDNCSLNGKDCPGLPSSSESYLINYVEKDLGRTVGVNAGFYGIFSPDKPGVKCVTANNVAKQYQALVDYKADACINYGNICDGSYQATLRRLSTNIAKLLTNQFPLKSLPDKGTFAVTGKRADGTAITENDYTLSANVLTFLKGHEPVAGGEITVKYQVTQP